MDHTISILSDENVFLGLDAAFTATFPDEFRMQGSRALVSDLQRRRGAVVFPFILAARHLLLCR